MSASSMKEDSCDASEFSASCWPQRAGSQERDEQRRASSLPPEAQARAFACLLRLDLAIARSGARDERSDQATRRCRHFIDRAIERFFVRLRRFIESAQLAYELQRCGPNLDFGGRRVEVEERLDVSAHRTQAVRGIRESLTVSSLPVAAQVRALVLLRA